MVPRGAASKFLLLTSQRLKEEDEENPKKYHNWSWSWLRGRNENCNLYNFEICPLPSCCLKWLFHLKKGEYANTRKSQMFAKQGQNGEWQINGFGSSWGSAEAGRAFSRQEWGHRLIRKPSLQSNRGRRPWSGTKIQQSTFLLKATWDLQLCCEFLLSIRGRRTKASAKCSKCEFSSLPPGYQLSEEM